MHRLANWPVRLLLLCLLLLGAGSLIAAGYLVTQDQYVIYDGDTAVSVSGSFATVQEVLDAAALQIRPADLVVPPLTDPASPDIAIQIQRAKAVILRTEAEGARTFWTQQPTLAAFLQEVGVSVQRTTQVFANGTLIPFGALTQAAVPDEIEIGRFLTITIDDGERQQIVRTAKQTVGAALQEAGITLFAADGVEPPLGDWLQPDMTIHVQRSMPLTIEVDGRTIQTRSHHSNALDVLAEAGIGLIGEDYTRPGPDVKLQANNTIQVVRVTTDFRVEDTAIPYQTVWQATDQLAIDQKAVISYGEAGILRQRIRMRYENGVLASETVDGEWVAREAINQVIGYGTRITLGIVDTPEGPREYWRVVQMRVTSYTAASSGKEPGDPGYGRTASGLPAGFGIVAVDRNVIPFRSSVFVPGYGVGYAGDTGGGVRGRWIDLGYDEDNYVSWSGYVDVYYLTPVPAAEDINYLLPDVLP
ncbi:MAG: DUF348 domain-containing protein [Anaerolineales bacterium]|nr:DUF348 domain-containing protein [Anaerolineales bacterium]